MSKLIIGITTVLQFLSFEAHEPVTILNSLLSIRQDFQMTTVMNQKLTRSYIKALQDKLIKKVKQCTKKVTTEDLIDFIFQILPSKPINDFSRQDALRIIQDNHETIIDNRCEIDYLRRKAKLEDELTASFIKNLLKDKIRASNQAALNRTMCKNSSFLNLPNGPSLSRYQSSIIQPRSSGMIDSLVFDRSPIGSISKKQQQEEQRYAPCSTSRSKFSNGLGPSSELAQEMEPQQRQKLKALRKLRKLEKYVFQKQNIHKQKSGTKLWNGGISPTKMRYKEQNENLKVIQSNLVTHLTLLEKFRQIPSIEGLVAREEALKKKERHLKELSETLEKKELSLNKKHSDFLKRQKSQKVL